MRARRSSDLYLAASRGYTDAQNRTGFYAGRTHRMRGFYAWQCRVAGRPWCRSLQIGRCAETQFLIKYLSAILRETELEWRPRARVRMRGLCRFLVVNPREVRGSLG